MAFSYVVSNHKPTAVNNCCAGSFTGPDDINLIVSKSTILEIYLINPEGLKLVKEYTLNGKIVCLQLFKPYTRHSKKNISHSPHKDKDLLFILTHKYNVCILECMQDETGNINIVTRAFGNVQEKIGRPSETGMIASVDPEGRVIGLRLYDGIYKIIRLDNRYYGTQSGQEPPTKAEELKSFNVNIEERKIVDIKFLEGFEVPTLALINQDSEGRHFRTYKLADRELLAGPWTENNIEAEASMIIPIAAAAGGGLLIVGQESVMYFRDNAPFAIRPPVMKQNSMTCYCKVDPDGSRYLLGDMGGRLFMLTLDTEEDAGGARMMGGDCSLAAVRDLKLDLLGETSIPECLTYIDNGVVYVGSRLGDSQLIRLRTVPTTGPDAGSDNGLIPAVPSYVEVLESFTNLGPIVDMVVVDAERSGHKDQLVTCSGAFKDGTLRILRDGIGINECAALELPGDQQIRGLWSLKNTVTNADSLLVTSFVDRTTRVLSFSGPDCAEEVEEIDLPGLRTIDVVTLYCGDVANNNVLQITTQSCSLIDRINSRVIVEWIPTHSTSNNAGLTNEGSPAPPITVAACNGRQIVLASGRELYYLEVERTGLALINHVTCPNEVACLDVTPLDGPGRRSTRTGPPQPARFLAAGFWTEVGIRLYSLPALELLHHEPFTAKADVIPRSLVLCPFESSADPHLLVGLGNGTLYYYKLDPATGRLRDRKKAVVGTRPPLLKIFESGPVTGSSDMTTSGSGGSGGNSNYNVFVCSDRPTIIYSRNGKLIFSSVNMKEVSYVCPFDSPQYPDSLILSPSTSSSLILIGTIDEIRKLHIRTIALGESPRRVAYQESTNTFGLISVRMDVHNGTTFMPSRPNSISVRAPYHSSGSSFGASSNKHHPTSSAQNYYRTLEALPNGVTTTLPAMPSSSLMTSTSSSTNIIPATFGDEAEAHSFVILDGQSLEPLWAHHFQPYEFATSLITCHLTATAPVQPSETDGARVEPEPAGSVLEPIGTAGVNGLEKSAALTEYYVVGTAMVYPEEAEPRQGRILVFEYSSPASSGSSGVIPDHNVDAPARALEASAASAVGGRLTLVTEKDVSGAPYTLVEFAGHKLLATINSTVRLFEWTGGAERDLRLECSHFNNILALYAKVRGDYVLVGDLMRSITLLNYKALEGSFEEVARDYNPAWTCAIEVVDDDNFLAAENSYNLYVCQKDGVSCPVASENSSANNKKNGSARQSSAATTASAGTATGQNGSTVAATLEDERRHFYPVGLFHLAEFVNIFRKGSLVTRNAGESLLDIANPILMGTVSGSVHLMVQLQPKVFELLSNVQKSIASVVPSLGKIDHEYYRSFATEQKCEKPCGFLDGDLIESFLDLSVADKDKIVEKITIDLEDFPHLLEQSVITNYGGSKPMGHSGVTEIKGEEAMEISGIEGMAGEATSLTISNSAKRPVTVEEVVKIIEDLSRLH